MHLHLGPIWELYDVVGGSECVPRCGTAHVLAMHAVQAWHVSMMLSVMSDAYAVQLSQTEHSLS